MHVILLERVARLGAMGEVVDVKAGHARNFLLPRGKALRASKENVARFEARKTELQAANEESRREAQALSQKLDGKQFVVIRAAADTGALYGSVNTRDAAQAASAEGYPVDRRQVSLARPIRALGLHPVTISLHPEVDAEITLNVARSESEAEQQASGKSIQELAAEEEAQAEFEVAELFDDMGGALLDEDETRTEQIVEEPSVQEKEELDDRLDR